MKSFFAFVRKEFYHILRDRRTLLILFGMPVVQIILFGYAVTNEFKGADIGVWDQSKDALSTELITRLEASGHFSLAYTYQSRDQVERAFQDAEIKMAVIIPADFGATYYSGRTADIQLITDGTNPNTANTLVNYASAIVQGFQREQTDNRPLPFQISVDSRMVYNPELLSVFMFVPGVMTLILMLVSAMMTSLTIAREKELGTMELLLVSPLSPMTIILGKVTPYILLSLINTVIILAVSYFVFKVPIVGSLWLLLGLSLVFILMALALGILISTRTTTQQSAMMISLIMLMMPTMLLSGFIFPIESMPVILQYLSNIIPAKYFIIMLKDVMLKGSALTFIWNEMVVLLGMTVFFLLLSWKNFSIRLGG
ncbi:ABC transporter permease [Flavilitoribacter nigricans]|uniref:Multidrug ABC transporter permease n=1 Tax=Flavilitoribacter nigricans (strain ATCC 23147 / DSM 23189 / NBRC 102662 / NCIMB 1420 / SS-2) TaxID=1122177 RepID=A0A2D0N4A0_FLAN2|nr:ABC transporter permease [Flavilitoribacter nigricans]PHN03206.1 multidrug ABC transporter permease [Flavilitoribacter nigricans DSM 23189 = NBRC 102662]